ncbi:MAG: hypothetical protein H7Z71_03110 [Moraxellaceae bacterium]|nr:hypothetical protein [Pseudobdellovibrionaceae bacterium]
MITSHELFRMTGAFSIIDARLGILAINYEASMWKWPQDPQNPMEK